MWSTWACNWCGLSVLYCQNDFYVHLCISMLVSNISLYNILHLHLYCTKLFNSSRRIVSLEVVWRLRCGLSGRWSHNKALKVVGPATELWFIYVADGGRLPTDRIRRIGRGNLEIRDVERDDSGLYRCSLTNASHVSAEAMLYVCGQC